MLMGFRSISEIFGFIAHPPSLPSHNSNDLYLFVLRSAAIRMPNLRAFAGSEDRKTHISVIMTQIRHGMA